MAEPRPCEDCGELSFELHEIRVAYNVIMLVCADCERDILGSEVTDE